MQLIKPPKLRKGDTIGIVSPSSSIRNFPRRLERGIKSLSEMGFSVKLGAHALNMFGQNAGTPEERAADINEFFTDSSVHGIICSTGGWNSNAVLPLIDYDAIRENPKVFCGFSDITAITNAIFKKSGLVTFNGPTILPSFGEFGGIDDFTRASFEETVMSNNPVGEIQNPSSFTDEILWWETEDNRKRVFLPASGQKYLTDGVAEGVLIGGNLITLCILGGTEYLPDFTDAILFLEEEGESTSTLERRLNYFEQLEILGKIKGIVFGRPSHFRTDSDKRTLYDILTEFGRKYKIPVVTDVDIGHTTPLITLPLGIFARIDSRLQKFSLLESSTI